MKLSALVICNLAALLISSAVSPAFSQNNNSGVNNSQKKPVEELRTYFKKVEKPEKVSDLPTPGGVKYVGGLQRPDAKRGTMSVGERFSSKNSPQSVLEFYKNSLLSNQWKISSASNLSVQAKKGDRSVCISICPKSDLESATDFFVTYSYKSR